MANAVPASEFTRNFGRYRMLAQREAVAVSSHGQVTGYFVGPDEYQALKRAQRRSRAVADFTAEEIEHIGQSRMSSEHDHLNALLDEK